MIRYKFDKGRHYHSLDGKPLIGTSGVSSVIAKPLTWWASGLAVKEFGCPEPKVLTKIKNKAANKKEIEEFRIAAMEAQSKIRTMSEYEYMQLIDKAYRAHTTTLVEKASEGTDLHAELERYVKDQMEGITEPIKKYHARIQPFIDWFQANVDKVLWSEINCYSETHWLGGISDFGFLDKQGRAAIMDFKSSKVAYMTQFWQCAAYDMQITENGGYNQSGKKIFTLDRPISYYAIFPFGADSPAPSLEFDVGGCKEAFLHMLWLYKKLPQN